MESAAAGSASAVIPRNSCQAPQTGRIPASCCIQSKYISAKLVYLPYALSYHKRRKLAIRPDFPSRALAAQRNPENIGLSFLNTINS
jgi:hypothetical protein